jgi:hypothetical protein
MNWTAMQALPGEHTKDIWFRKKMAVQPIMMVANAYCYGYLQYLV